MSPYNNIINTYQKQADMELDARAIMARLIHRVILNMKAAQEAHAQRHLETMVEWNAKSLQILSFIRTSLNESQLQNAPPQALEIAAQLRRLFQDIHIRLANVLLSKDTQGEYTYFMETLRNIYQTWSQNDGNNQVVSDDSVNITIKSPAVANTPTVGGATSISQQSSAGQPLPQDFFA